MNKKKYIAIIYAVVAAIFYAINMPASKILLEKIDSTLMASFLYFGAGIGIGIIYIINNALGKNIKSEQLSKEDLPYTIGMIILDIIAPISLMYGLSNTTSANASLLNNFEIVATSLIALIIFKEVISKRVWGAIVLITISSMLLSFEDMSSLQFSWGSIFIMVASICWGFENNCTRMISSKSTYEIVMLKGLCCGLGSFIIALVVGEKLPHVIYILIALLLGFVAYGLSIFFYIRAQKDLGAAKTSAYYAITPFVGALFSFTLLNEAMTAQYFMALIIMLLGSSIVVVDTILTNHSHVHTHTYVHIHDGSTHEHKIVHEHSHNHISKMENHIHKHSFERNSHH